MALAITLQVTIAVVACALQLYVIRNRAHKSRFSFKIALWNAAVAPIGVVGMYYLYGLLGFEDVMTKLMATYSYSSFFVAIVSLHLAAATVARYSELHPKRLIVG